MSDNTRWRKSSYSGTQGGNCIEVSDHTGRVLVRDTKDRGPVLAVSPKTWQAFTHRVRNTADPA